MTAVVHSVEKGSLAYKNKIKPGDVIEKINGSEIVDYLDYMYLSSNEKVEIELADRTVNIINEDFEPLGIEFESLLIDKPKSCRNKCIFCFIDQLPDCMRESCYFKDDDYRLSFLQGNYVTLTNLSDDELDRIVEYNIPRINVSVHTTNPELRVKMLNNKNAGKIMTQLGKFADAGLSINCQIVLCPDINDKEELDRTLSDLEKFAYDIESVSIVPVGLTKYRDGLFELKSFDKESSKEVISQVEKWQKKFKEKVGTNFVYLSDEFYIMAELTMPDFDEYDGFPQIENGVGLCASLKSEFLDAIEDCKTENVTDKTVATGKLSYNLLKELSAKVNSKINVVAIENNFFGENVTVSGLITGQDLINQLKDKDLGEYLLISASMLRHNEDVFLDNLTVSDVEKALDVKIIPVNNDGYELLEALLK